MAIPVITIKFVAKRKRWIDINSNNELNPEDYVTCNCGTQVKVKFLHPRVEDVDPKAIYCNSKKGHGLRCAKDGLVSYQVSSKKGTTTTTKIKSQNKNTPNQGKSKKRTTNLEQLASQVDNQQAVIVDMNSEFIPPELKDWKKFIDCYNTRKGTLIKFERINEKHWKLVNEKKKQKWTVGKWYEWLEQERQKPAKSHAYYLVDILVPSIHVKTIREDPVIDAFSFKGKLCLSQYIMNVSEDIAVPDVAYKGFLSPPWGNLMTFPHQDGFGTQLSVHCVMMGTGYNLVHYWPRMTASQEYLFRQILELPQIGQPQTLPHDGKDFTVDGNKEAWDESLEAKLIACGIHSSSVKVYPGQSIILPPNQFHCFKKIHKADQGPDQESSIPMLGIACDSTYIGATEKSFKERYSHIQTLHAVHPWNDHLYCINELALYCLIDTIMNSASKLNEDSIFRAHATAALPLFKLWLKQQNDWRNKALSFNAFIRIEEIVLPIDNYEQELACSQCQSPITNIFISNVDQNEDDNKEEQISCMNCFLSVMHRQTSSNNERDKKKRVKAERYFIKYRLAPIDQLDTMLDKTNQIIGGKRDDKMTETTSATENQRDDEFAKNNNNNSQHRQDTPAVTPEFVLSLIEKQSQDPIDSPQSTHFMLNQVGNCDIIMLPDDLQKEEKEKAKRKIILLPTTRKRKADKDNVKYPPTKQQKLLHDRTTKISLKAIDILRSSHEWLSDEIVDHFIEKVKQKHSADDQFYFFSSVFYGKIKYGPSKVDHWTLPDLFSYKYIIIPVLESSHWTLLVICNPHLFLYTLDEHDTSNVFYFDPLEPFDRNHYELQVTHVVRFLEHYFQTKWLLGQYDDATLVTFKSNNYTVNIVNTYKQKNGVDCGVIMLHFVMLFVRYSFNNIESVQCNIWEATLDTEWMRSYIMDILTEVREIDTDYYQNVSTHEKITVSRVLNDFAGGVPDRKAQPNNADLVDQGIFGDECNDSDDVPILEREYKVMDIDIPLTDENHEHDKLSHSPEKDVVAVNRLFFDNKDTVKLTAMSFDEIGCSTVYLDSEKPADDAEMIDKVNNNSDDDDDVELQLKIFPPELQDLNEVKKSNGLLSASVLDAYIKTIPLDCTLFYIIPAHYSPLILENNESLITHGLRKDLLSIKYIIIPIHQQDHWRLIIIANICNCFVDQRQNRLPKNDDQDCCVFLFDSFKAYELEEPFPLIYEFLTNIGKTKLDMHFEADKVKKYDVPVVQQKNEYDCGLYVLHLIETFIKTPFDKKPSKVHLTAVSKRLKAKSRRDLIYRTCQPYLKQDNETELTVSRRALEEEIEFFMPLVRDIVEGKIENDRSKQWKSGKSDERRRMGCDSHFGGFAKKEVDSIFEIIHMKIQSGQGLKGVALINYISFVVWPELAVAMLCSRKGLGKFEAEKLLLADDMELELERKKTFSL